MVSSTKFTTNDQSQKFNATLKFSHRPPYEPLFAERVPLLQAFQCALASYAHKRAQAKQCLRSRLVALLNPSTHPFRAVECGVYMGNSLIACALMARDMAVPYRMIGMDTFSGLPPLSAKDKSLAPMGARYLSTTVFDDTSIESVQAEVVRAGLERNIELLQGLFSEILPTLPEQAYHFVNIDCDLYEPHIECLEYFYPRMESGGIIFFDDYHSVEFPMAGQAIDYYMRDKPEKFLHLRFGEEAPNRTKCFIIKY
jgi:O-methyltransferase